LTYASAGRSRARWQREGTLRVAGTSQRGSGSRGVVGGCHFDGEGGSGRPSVESGDWSEVSTEVGSAAQKLLDVWGGLC
jgi:hypothetical protein